jgi:hypothetical protein
MANDRLQWSSLVVPGLPLVALRTFGHASHNNNGSHPRCTPSTKKRCVPWASMARPIRFNAWA